MATKIPVAVRVDADLMERLRNAVWHLGKGLTITSVFQSAIERAVKDLERQNGGRPFSPRTSELPKSRKREK